MRNWWKPWRWKSAPPVQHVRRPIEPRERALLTALASRDPDRAEQYLREVAEVSEVEDWNDGSYSISLWPDDESHPDRYRPRVEATAEDEDGSVIEIILFGNERRPCVLEFVTYGRAVRRYPDAATLKDVWDYRGEPRPKGW